MAKMRHNNWQVKPLSSNVHEISVDADWRNKDFEFWLLQTSDWHYDNPKCDRRLLHKHLSEANEKGAPVICNGDLFCLMQGKNDRRGSKPDVRPEHQVADYYDAVARTSADDLSQYAQSLALVGYGNHETAIIKHQETDVLRSFAYRMNHEHNSPVQVGGYGGWVFFRFRDIANPRRIDTKRMKYYHGSGGGGPVTKGVIKTNRMAVYLPDADIVTTGHIHERWAVRLTQERVTAQGRVYHRDQLHLCSGAYKEEYGDGSKGWHVERGAPPKPMGGYWIKFTSRLGETGQHEIVAQEIPCV